MTVYLIKVIVECPDSLRTYYLNADSIGTAISHVGGSAPYAPNVRYSAEVIGEMTHPACHDGGTIAVGLTELCLTV